MKKILSFGLASAMVMSMGAAAFAKDDDALYPIGAISTNAYLYDSDDYAVLQFGSFICKDPAIKITLVFHSSVS